MKRLQFIDIPNSSTCFGQFFAHPQERKTMFYSMWYNATKLLPAGGLERGRHLLQGGSNMTGTAAACLHTNQSWSYMNHLVQCCTKVTQLTILQYEDTIPLNDTVKVTSLIENVHMHEHVRAHAHVPSHTHTHTQTSPCPCNVST